MPLLEYAVKQEQPTEQTPIVTDGKRPKQKLVSGVNDLAARYPEVAALWDEEQNGDLKPTQILPGSNKKVWWRCERDHHWEAPPYVLTIAGSRCPYCAGRKVIPGENDLETKYPEVAKLWDKTANGEIDPSQIMPGTKRKHWWRCKEGHSWQAAVYSLTLLNSGCPYCGGHKAIPGETDLATRFPKAAALWAVDLNEGVSASQIAPRSRKPAWWRCDCGHEWRAQVHSVVVGSRCPACAWKRRGKKMSKVGEVSELHTFNDVP